MTTIIDIPQRQFVPKNPVPPAVVVATAISKSPPLITIKWYLWDIL